VAVDHHTLLAALVEREDQEPGVPLDGARLLQHFGSLAVDDPRAWESLARAAAQLCRLGWIDWRYTLWPAETAEPIPQFIDSQKIQQAQDIVVNDKGFAALASRQQTRAMPPQVNVVNSTVGQFALGNIHNVTITTILDAVEACIDSVNAAPEAKKEARSVVRRMREAATTVASSTAQSVLETALRNSLGLP
jgi:hypothetical protein